MPQETIDLLGTQKGLGSIKIDRGEFITLLNMMEWTINGHLDGAYMRQHVRDLRAKVQPKGVSND